MKIIIPIIGFSKSGGSRVLSKLANEFIKAGHEVFFICPKYNSQPYYSTDAEIVAVDSLFSSHPIVNVLFGLFSVWRKVRAMKEGCVIANHNLTAYMLFFLPAKFKKFYYVQAYEFKLASTFFGKVLAYFSYWLPIDKVVNSNSILPNYFNRVVGIVPAGVDLELFDAKSNIYNKARVVKIGCVGREERYKGTAEIVLAFERLCKDYNVVLNVAVFMPRIPDKIKHLVSFTSVDSDEKLASFYKGNDIIIATGLIEDGAFHYPCAEGMAVGKVVVSNYAPLCFSSSVPSSALKLHNVSVEVIFNSLEYALNMSGEDQAHAVRENIEIMKSYGWSMIGVEFLDILRKGG